MTTTRPRMRPGGPARAPTRRRRRPVRPATPTGPPVAADGGEPVALPSPRGMVRGVVATLARPRPVAREAARLGRDAVRILRGTDEIAPSPKDERFADPAWSLHPGYRRLAQSYLATAAAAGRLVDDLEAGGADWREVEQVRLGLTAPTARPAPQDPPGGT